MIENALMANRFVETLVQRYVVFYHSVLVAYLLLRCFNWITQDALYFLNMININHWITFCAVTLIKEVVRSESVQK